MPLNKPVRFIALFWGLVVFMPVGLNYLAFFALALCMLFQGARMERVRRVRRHMLFWPMAAYVAWTALVLLVQPVWYAETPSNLWHCARIVLTLALALALTPDEAIWALRGFVLAVALSVLLIGLHYSVGLATLPLWRNLFEYSGNKSISNAILMSLLAGSALVLALAGTGRLRVAAAVVALVALVVIVVALPNRTSLFAVLGAPAVAAVHRWRHNKRQLLLMVAGATALSALFVIAVPTVQTKLVLGLNEIQQAGVGEVSLASWNVRVQLARHTGRMMLEKPWMGWGIGAWNDQWRKRVPPLIADFNMPHDDFLWMGAQAGVPGAMSWLAIMLAACWVGWRREDLTGRLVFIAALTLLFSAMVNSATRDGVIGLSLLWIVGLYLRLGTEAGAPFFRVLGLREPIALQQRVKATGEDPAQPGRP